MSARVLRVVLVGGVAIWLSQCDAVSPGDGKFCDAPPCDCNDGDSCAAGFFCQDGTCVPDEECADPDGDGYCDCCSAGPDCPAGEGDVRVNPGARDVCDGIDNNCDGRDDPSGCVIDSQGGPDDPFMPTGGGLNTNPDGSLTLSTGAEATDFAWPSNDAEGTISRIDTITNREVGRYPTVLNIAGGNPADPTNPPPVSDWDSGCNRPSRSTVDLNGNAYVANRAHAGGGCSKQGTVTKIGFYDEAACGTSLALCQCIDRNHSGQIETSRDCNGEGADSTGLCPDGSTPDGIDISNPNEFLGYADECVLWTVPVGANNSNARAMAIDANGFVWVGDWQNSRMHKLEPGNGQPVNPIDPTKPPAGIDVDGQPYGAVVDSRGGLWYVNTFNTGQIQRLDTATGAVDPMLTSNPSAGYGITVDRRDRVWLASLSDTEGGGTVARYDQDAGTWEAFSAGLSGSSWKGRGLTATPAGVTNTGAGVVWAAFHSGAQAWLVGFDDDSGQVWDAVDLASTCGADTGIGVGLGTGGSVWVVNQGSDNVCRYDPGHGDPIAVAIGNSPYTYSDFTGNVLRNFTAPHGTYRTVIEGCPDHRNIDWAAVIWDADTPGDTKISVSVKAADTVAELPSATPHGPVSQPPESLYDLLPLKLVGDLLAVEVTLFSDDAGLVPTLFSLQVTRTCYNDPL